MHDGCKSYTLENAHEKKNFQVKHFLDAHYYYYYLRNVIKTFRNTFCGLILVLLSTKPQIMERDSHVVAGQNCMVFYSLFLYAQVVHYFILKVSFASRRMALRVFLFYFTGFNAIIFMYSKIIGKIVENCLVQIFFSNN